MFFHPFPSGTVFHIGKVFNSPGFYLNKKLQTVLAEYSYVLKIFGFENRRKLFIIRNPEM
jgi:hypothetical protein